MARVVKRAYRYRFYPSPEQAAELSRTFGCVRLVWNKALDARTSAWYQRQERVSYVQSSAMLTQWKAGDDLTFLNEVSCVPLQQALRHLQGAFAAFWGQRSGYPRFKSRRHSRASAEYTRSAFRWRDGELTLAKMSQPLDIRWSQPLPAGAEPSTVVVSRDPADRWHVSLLTECPVEALPPSRQTVGIDAGITSLLTLSTGEKIANPRHERRDRVRLAKAQRNLSRKAKGSANRQKARVRVARVHARIAERRRDHLQKLSTRIIRENQAVIIEDLSARNMVRNHTGLRRDPRGDAPERPRVGLRMRHRARPRRERGAQYPGRRAGGQQRLRRDGKTRLAEAGTARPRETGNPGREARNPRPSGRGVVNPL